MDDSRTIPEPQTSEFKDPNYELFIFALSILSICNIFLDIIFPDPNVSRIIFVIDLLLSFIFMIDFLYRLKTAESKREYFFKQWGWLDLIGAIPLPRAKIARMARIIRVGRGIRAFGLRNLIHSFLNDRAGSALYTVAFLVILVLEFGSFFVLRAEQYAPGANITSANDALWWAFVTMSTVGYGDQYPVTIQGRFLALFVILIGVGLFGVVTGFLANAFLGGDDRQKNEDDAPTLESIAATLDEIMKMQTVQGEAIEILQAHFDDLEQLFKTGESEM